MGYGVTNPSLCLSQLGVSSLHNPKCDTPQQHLPWCPAVPFCSIGIGVGAVPARSSALLIGDLPSTVRSWGVCFTYGTWFGLEALACMQHMYHDR